MAQTSAYQSLKPIIDLSECLTDSPKFRLVLEQNENDLLEFETKIDKIVKLCSIMVEIGKSFIKAKSNFINGIWDLLVYFKDDPLIISSLNRIVHTLTELLKYDTILIDQANRAVGKNMSTFLRDDIHKAKDTKRHFDKMSDEYDSMLNRHSQIPRNKANECEEVSNLLTATRSCFQHLTLDYVTQLSVLKNKKRHEVLDSLLSLMHAYGTYYHQGSDLFQDFDPFKKDTASHIIDMRNGTTILEKKLESRHTMVSAKECIPQLIKGSTIRLEGYLFKRTSNTFKTWNRRYFVIQDHQLVYQKRSHEKELTVMEEDLRLCTAKPVQFMERRFCFEVLSPSKSHILQADSEETCQQWISAMQAGIDAAYNHNDAAVDIQSVDSQDSWGTASSNSSANKSSSVNNLLSATDGSCGGGPPPAKPPRVTYTQIVAIPGNEFCCDCGAADPKWASINIGTTLCIECSGIHRGLGVHLSKVRSLNLDAWDLELIKVMSSLGNTIINTIYEAKVDESVAQRAKSDSDRTHRELWIKAKYVKRAFVDKLQVDLLSINEQQLPLSSTHSTIICDHNKSGEQIEPNVDNESHNTFNSTLSCVQMSDTTVSKCDNISQMADKRNEELVESDSEESDSEESTKLILSDNTSKNVTQNCDNNCHTLSDDKQVVTLGREYDRSAVENNSSIKSMPSGDNNKVYNLMLYKAAIDCDMKVMCEALAKGAIINWHNADDENRTALHQAISTDRVTPCEYLLLNGAKSSVADDKGITPLHLATQRGNTGQVCLLLKRGADQKCTDSDGHNALSIAVNNANADIVTLLRLAKLNDEMKNDEEFGNISDETFNEVVRDFTQLAAQSPEKLRRNTIQSEPKS